MHGLGEGTEALRILVFNDQGFGGFGAGDAFVEGAGDLGVDFPNFPVPMENPVLEVAGEHGNGRHDEDDHQRQPPVEDQHGGKGAKHVKHGPEDIRHVPGDHAGNPVGVAHHPGQNVAHRGDVVKGEGQSLQVGEKDPPHVSAHAHFNVHGVPAESHHRQCLEENDCQVAQAIGDKPLERSCLNEISNGSFDFSNFRFKKSKF